MKNKDRTPVIILFGFFFLSVLLIEKVLGIGLNRKNRHRYSGENSVGRVNRLLYIIYHYSIIEFFGLKLE